MGKRLVGSGDLKFQHLGEIDRIKELTGGDRINVEAKFKDSCTIQYNGLLWWNTNELPSFSGDTGEHTFERFIILSCDNVIPEEERDSKLREKIYAEREVLVSVAVAYLKQSIERGYTFTESDRTKKNRENYEKRMNSLKYFLKECCEVGIGRTNTAEFKRKYYNWCDKNGLTPERQNSISKKLINDFGISRVKSSNEFYELTIKPNQEEKQA